MTTPPASHEAWNAGYAYEYVHGTSILVHLARRIPYTSTSGRFHRPFARSSTSLLQSNIEILKHDCGVAQLLLDAATCRANSLYLGLDISTQSTGYAVLRPSALPINLISTLSGNRNSFDSIDGIGCIDDIDCIDGGRSEPEERLLRAAGLAELLEWGCIAGSGSGSKKKDVVDVGVIVEEALRDVATRCRPSSGQGGTERGDGGEGASSQSPSPPPLSPQSSGDEDGQDGLGVNGSAGAFLLLLIACQVVY